MLNNQPMGFYHPSTLVKDAQRHGVRFAPIDVQVSDWPCRVEPDGRVRLGLMYVNGLRREAGRGDRGVRAMTRGARREVAMASVGIERCPKCGCDDPSMLETLHTHEGFCNVCSHLWTLPVATPIDHRRIGHRAIGQQRRRLASTRSTSSIRRCGLRRDEVATLAEIGALNAFGFDRRTALWQVEQAVRPAGELFEEREESSEPPNLQPPTSRPPRLQPPRLRPMTVPERLLADYAGTSLTIGPHPMSLRRPELALRGVLRASDLPRPAVTGGACASRER